MWQRFTERARKVVFYAQEEAQNFGEGYVSTEHLLLGLVRESDCIACRVIEKLGLSPARIRSETEKQLPRGDARPSQDMTLTPRAKRVIDLAYDEARHLNNNYIGTEHLLLGLIREGDGLAGRVLHGLGIELEGCRRQVLELQDQEGRHNSPSERPRPRSVASAQAELTFMRSSALMADLLAQGWKHSEDLGQAFGSEHVLLALCATEHWMASDILAQHGLTVESLKAELLSRDATSKEDPSSGVDQDRGST
jgi:ATP-dependent Clp protease ATP-binding subunit ClpC